ncbi:cbb3-type cytochrome c oxidase subunit I [Acetobacteraceae bacterium ESL0709]|nr:cbb3-type cytochrome c oxidase subunit I [Acetobacteraceae bacterium ESL0697]MDF7677784.1 cbb3-type cytochrome c oxidase subunit I [Acetobacteraceae bacterium ESL0709]
MIDYSEQAMPPLSTPRSRIGSAYLLLALFAGLLGGAMTLPFINAHPTTGLIVSHALLMGFFVVVPGVLGGMAYWLLPQSIGARKMALPSFSLLAWLLLAVGIIALPLRPAMALMLWSVGVTALSVDLIATILEERSKPYRVLSPMVWSFLFSAIGLMMIAPVMMALLVKGKVDLDSASSLMTFFQIPELSLLILPAFGMVAQALLPARETFAAKMAPYLFGVIGFLAPLLWVKSLFCSMPLHNGFYIMVLAQFVPALIFLVSLCLSLWSTSFRQSAAPYWAVMAVVLLFIGSVSALLSPTHYAAFSAIGDVSRGHQSIIFGSLLALCAGFYAWMSQIVPFFSKGYLEIGIAHAFVTFVAMLCFMLPQAQLFSVVLTAVSILGFVFMGFFACASLKQRRASLKRSFVKG